MGAKNLLVSTFLLLDVSYVSAFASHGPHKDEMPITLKS